MQIAPRAAARTLAAERLGGRQFAHLPMLHFLAELLTQRMGSPLDDGIMRNPFDRPLCSTQLDFDISHFSEQLFQTFR
jgi:hypothetical protein